MGVSFVIGLTVLLHHTAVMISK